MVHIGANQPGPNGKIGQRQGRRSCGPAAAENVRPSSSALVRRSSHFLSAASRNLLGELRFRIGKKAFNRQGRKETRRERHASTNAAR